jgi:hypothetical protein
MNNKSFGLKIEEPTQEILDFFAPVEGNNCLYFGRVRNGKTYSATADIIELLKRGEIVYANWDITFKDYDERQNFFVVFLKFVTGYKYFYKFTKDNFHYFEPDKVDPVFLSRLVGVHIFIDEGQWLFNSHIRDKAEDEVAIAKRKLILHGGHYCRSLNVITQRTTNVFPDIRSQIAIWYHCEKKFSLGRLIIFQRSEIQDMKQGEPDMEAVIHTKVYFGKKEVYDAYNTHAMRESDAIEEEPVYEVYALTGSQRLNLLLAFVPFVGRFIRQRKAKAVKQPMSEYPQTLKGFVYYVLGIRLNVVGGQIERSIASKKWDISSLKENSGIPKTESGPRPLT